jgi:hypothetical protein
MSYSNFSLDILKERFGLQITTSKELFVDVEGVSISQWLKETLQQNYPVAIAIHTEKARSEMIVAPVLLEVRRQLDNRISLFSGVEFNVDAKLDLKGVCDFLFCDSPEQLSITSPVVTIVEAKNDNLKNGIPQCIAEMEAARLFNYKRGKPIPEIFGVVTTGTLWQFLRLKDQRVEVDSLDYHINDVDRIVGVLLQFFADPQTQD